ncbi:MAG: sodium:solute symporter [Sedimentisphaeraceae bacterium JB056]
MFGLHLIDIITVIGYFVVVLGIGVWASRRIKSEEDYFLGGRRFGKFVQAFAAFGQATSSDSAVGTTVMLYRNGMSSLSSLFTQSLTIPFYWITCIWYRRLRTLTLGDFFAERYQSKKMPAFYAVMCSLFFMLVCSVSFIALSKTVSAIVVKPIDQLTAEERFEYDEAVELQNLEKTDVKMLSQSEIARMEQLRLEKPRIMYSYINEDLLIIIVAVIVLLYAVMGGLEAAFLTDTVQGFCIIILSLLLIPFAFIRVNEVFGGSGITGVIEAAKSQLPQASFDLWGSPAMLDFTWYFIAASAVMMFLNVAVQPNQLVACGSAKDEYTARAGFCAGIYIKRVVCIIWGVTGLILIVLFANRAVDPDYIWGMACRELLGPLNLGLLGLMIACLMAALMSTADCLMLTVSSLLTNNLYVLLVKGKSQAHYIWAGRLFGVLFIAGAVGMIYLFDSFFYMMKMLWEFNVVLAASFWLGMKWRRANHQGAWASMLITLFLFGILPSILSQIPSVKTSEYMCKTTEQKVVSRSYVAREVDVEQREEAIATWEELAAAGKADVAKPEMLDVGQRFDKEYIVPARAVFWTQDLGMDEEGNTYGKGMVNVELIILDKLGFDLTKNPYALNETIRYIIRILFPFLVLFIVSKLTKPEDKDVLDRFYARLKTPVFDDKENDEKEVALSYENPSRFDYKKMFPNTDWEFEKFDKTDIKGVVMYTVLAFVVLAILMVVSAIGK